MDAHHHLSNITNLLLKKPKKKNIGVVHVLDFVNNLHFGVFHILKPTNY
jgi:hypothetical protein